MSITRHYFYGTIEEYLMTILGLTELPATVEVLVRNEYVCNIEILIFY